MDDLRMYAVFSPTAIKKMNGSRGKLAAQAGHAYLHAWWDAPRSRAAAYRSSVRAYKIALIAETDEQLQQLINEHSELTGTTYVIDAGLTVFDGPTATCVGIGPISQAERSELLARLKPL